MRRLLVALAAVVALAGCGETREVREPDVRVDDGGSAVAAPAPTPPPTGGRGVRIRDARIVAITHGQASDPFWAIVEKGMNDAATQSNVAVSYRAPDTYDIDRMVRLIDQAIGDHPDGLVISLPNARALAAAVRRAQEAQIPVVSINSGSDQYRKLGILAHVGQPEWRAGYESGRRLAGAGVRRALCVNQEVGNAGLDVRCRAFAAGLRVSGARSEVLPVPLQDPAETRERVVRALASGRIDGILTLGPAGATPVLAALRAGGIERGVRVATFDLTPEVLAAVREERMLFAVDQQPYLQGYLPIVLLAQRARHGLLPAEGELIATGPNFVTAENALQAMRLSRAGIR